MGIGTFVRIDAARPSAVPLAQLESILPSPGIVGLLVNQSWADVEPTLGSFDYRTAGVVAQIAAEHGLEFHWRIVAGSHTPTFHMGATWVPKDPNQGGGLATGLTLPCPFTSAGRLNRPFIHAYRDMVTNATAWGLANGLTGFHASHWGGRSAELCVIPELSKVPGYNEPLVLDAHVRLLHVAQALTVPLVEFPISGFAPRTFTTAFADAMRASARLSYLSANFLSDRTDPTPLVNWPYGVTPPHNVQMIHEYPPPPRSGSWNWAQVYANAKRSGAEHVEQYLKSFTLRDGGWDTVLLAEIAKAASG